MEPVDVPDIVRDFRPACPLLCPCLLLVFRQVVRHIPFPGKTPGHRIGAITRHQVAPVLLHFVQPEQREEIPPATDDAGQEARIDQILDTPVRHGEIGRIDARELRFPGETRFIGPPLIERRHIRIKAGYDLNDGEAFVDAIKGQRWNPCGQVSRCVNPIHQVSANQKKGVPSAYARWRPYGDTCMGPCR